jgi:ankyrin repeat domain-containing protein 50
MSLPPSPSTVDPNISGSRRPQVWVDDIDLTTLFNPTTNPAADVVFVHGLQGHPRKTWTYSGTTITRDPASESGPLRKTLGLFPRKPSKWTEKRIKKTVFWPMDLLPNDRNDIRIMTYGYDSHVTKFFQGSANQTNISEHGRSFLNSLASNRYECQDRPIIFVAHSLGGLIVKEALRRSRDERHQKHLRNVYTSTHATIFFGVPHRGSGDAGWGEVLRRIASVAQFDTAKPLLADLDPSSGSAKLDELSEAFSDMLDEQGFGVYSFQESQGKMGVKILNQLVSNCAQSFLNQTDT